MQLQPIKRLYDVKVIAASGYWSELKGYRFEVIKRHILRMKEAHGSIKFTITKHED